MQLSNSSLLDEATAAAEAMTMCSALARGKKDKFLVSVRPCLHVPTRSWTDQMRSLFICSWAYACLSVHDCHALPCTMRPSLDQRTNLFPMDAHALDDTKRARALAQAVVRAQM